MSTDDPIEIQISDAFVARLETLSTLGDGQVFSRALHVEDQGPAIGIAISKWVPVANEIGGGTEEPTIQRHRIMLQTVLKHSDEIEGRRLGILLTKSIRSLVYRDAQLRDALSELRQESDGVIERVLRPPVVRGTDYGPPGTSGVFTFMSATEVWVDTQAG